MSFSLLGPAYVCRACRTRITSQAKRYASTKAKNKNNIPDAPVRTRFAPSPTGYLHLGSIRTALFNYLIAKRTGGQFLLRIEDTDQKRTISDAEQRLLADLRWLGLQWDEGPEVGGPHGPYRQSERTGLYRSHAEKLLQTGHAYRCFCSPEQLHAKGEARSKQGLATLYDRTCYHMSKEESDNRAAERQEYVVRLKAGEIPISYKDIVGGKYQLSRTGAIKAAAQGVFDDFILMKRDGLPTYHFANVVDDHHMKISHVIRGVEWQISTPKHLSLYSAFGWTPPAFGHIGLLLNEDGTKMSKRDMDRKFDLEKFKVEGMLPEALLNFLALHGWSHDKKSDFMSLKQLEKAFDLHLSNTNPTVSLAKLWYLQPRHAQHRVETGGQAYEDLLDAVVRAVDMYISKAASPALPALKENESTRRAYLSRVLKAGAKNYLNAPEFADSHSYFLVEVPASQPPTQMNWAKAQRIAEALRNAVAALSEGVWDHDSLASAVQSAVADLTQRSKKAEQVPADEFSVIGKKDAWQVLRALLADGKVGPSLIETMEILGRDVSLQRLGAYEAWSAS